MLYKGLVTQGFLARCRLTPIVLSDSQILPRIVDLCRSYADRSIMRKIGAIAELHEPCCA